MNYVSYVSLEYILYVSNVSSISYVPFAYINTRMCIFLEDANIVLLCVIVKTLTTFSSQIYWWSSGWSSFKHYSGTSCITICICFCVNFSNISSSPSLMWLSSSPRQAVDFGLSREFSFRDILLSSTTTSSTASYLSIWNMWYMWRHIQIWITFKYYFDSF